MQFNSIITLFNISFTKDRLSCDVISTKNIAHWQSKKNESNVSISDVNLSSNKISLIFNPNISWFFNILIVLYVSISI